MAKAPRLLSAPALDALKKVRSTLAPLDGVEETTTYGNPTFKPGGRRSPFWISRRGGIACGCCSTPLSDKTASACAAGFRPPRIRGGPHFAAGWTQSTGDALKHSCG